METTFMKNCFIKKRDGDNNIISGIIGDDGILLYVKVHLDKYAIVPMEHYNNLKSISEKAEVMIEG